MSLEFFEMTFGRAIRQGEHSQIRRIKTTKIEGGPDARDNIADQLGCDTDQVEDVLLALVNGVAPNLRPTDKNLDALIARADEEAAKENPRWRQARQAKATEDGPSIGRSGTPDGTGPSDETPFFEEVRPLDEILEETNRPTNPPAQEKSNDPDAR